jgi:hypothetical protein
MRTYLIVIGAFTPGVGQIVGASILEVVSNPQVEELPPQLFGPPAPRVSSRRLTSWNLRALLGTMLTPPSREHGLLLLGPRLGFGTIAAQHSSAVLQPPQMRFCLVDRRIDCHLGELVAPGS